MPMRGPRRPAPTRPEPATRAPPSWVLHYWRDWCTPSPRGRSRRAHWTSGRLRRACWPGVGSPARFLLRNPWGTPAPDAVRISTPIATEIVTGNVVRAGSAESRAAHSAVSSRGLADGRRGLGGHDVAAVDVDRLARDVRGRIGQQEHHDAR